MNATLQYGAYSPKEILSAAIKKAIINGYTFNQTVKSPDEIYITSFNLETGRLALMQRGEDEIKVIYDNYKLIFFEIDFAKALFGDEWEEHLEKISVSTDIFRHLHENIL